jgi:hypothetical protein
MPKSPFPTIWIESQEPVFLLLIGADVNDRLSV